MTSDPVSKAIALLARGHSLYGAGHLDAGVSDAPVQLRERADRLSGVDRQMAARLRGSAAADSELAAALAAANLDHAVGRRASGRVLDDARSDSMPAADTPLGRQEALGRMAARLRQQRHYLHRSQRNSRQLARRLRRLAYQRRGNSSAAALPISAVRYEKAYAPGRVRQRIAAALDHLGITDAAARRNWIRGYETLIARESGGRASAVGLGFAQGIAQTIPATFARYHQPGTSTSIYDPVANICASMNYVIHRYGVHRNGDNLAAMVQQADAHRPPKGY
jgi:SLT domain-containing protein